MNSEQFENIGISSLSLTAENLHIEIYIEIYAHIFSISIQMTPDILDNHTVCLRQTRAY